jgi:hypothetical protein
LKSYPFVTPKKCMRRRRLVSKTKDMIRRLIEFDHSITNTQIAEATGLSRQLVSYHARNLRMPRQSPNRSCTGCGCRIKRDNSTGLCRTCRPMSHAYEYQCAYCGTVAVVTGTDATNRRNSKRHKKNPDLDFCNSKCYQRYAMRDTIQA